MKLFRLPGKLLKPRIHNLVERQDTLSGLSFVEFQPPGGVTYYVLDLSPRRLCPKLRAISYENNTWDQHASIILQLSKHTASFMKTTPEVIKE